MQLLREAYQVDVEVARALTSIFVALRGLHGLLFCADSEALIQ